MTELFAYVTSKGFLAGAELELGTTRMFVPLLATTRAEAEKLRGTALAVVPHVGKLRLVRFVDEELLETVP